MSGRPVVFALVLAIAALAALPEAARGGPDERARQGLALYQQGKYAEAAVALEEAYSEQPSPETGFALAQALRMAGNCPRALRFYRQVVSEVAPGVQERIRQAMKPCEQEEAEREQAAQRERERDAARRESVLPAPSDPPPPGRAWYADRLGGALLAAGLAGLGASGVGFYRAAQHGDHARSAASESAFELELDREARARRWAIAASAMGGVAVLGAVVRYAWASGRGSSRRVAVAAGGGGVTIGAILRW
jgi:tetratricopeptide (TPR) repeat protein